MQIDLDGRMYEVRAKVMSLEGYSAHADQVGLIRFALGCKARRVVLVHGERRRSSCWLKSWPVFSSKLIMMLRWRLRVIGARRERISRGCQVRLAPWLMGGYGWALLSATLGVTMYARRLGNNMGFSSPPRLFSAIVRDPNFPVARFCLLSNAKKLRSVRMYRSVRTNVCRLFGAPVCLSGDVPSRIVTDS